MKETKEERNSIDAYLCRLIQDNRSNGAYEQLQERYRKLCIYLLKRYRCPWHLHEDALSVLYLHLYLAATRYKEQPQRAFFTFAYATLRGALLRFLDKESKKTVLSFERLEERLSTMEGGFKEIEIETAIRTASHDLPAAQLAWEGYSIKEIMKLLNCERTQVLFELGTFKRRLQSDIIRSTMGIDVYHGNGNLDLARIFAAGHSFVIHKVSQGTLPDPHFATFAAAPCPAGMVKGAYIYWDPECDMTAQLITARAELLRVGWQGITPRLPVALDLEVAPKNPKAFREQLHCALEYLNCQFNAGAHCLLYGSPAFLEQYLDASFSEYPLWIAHYNVKAPRLPSWAKGYKIWQYSDAGTVDGVQFPPVDLNRTAGPDTLKLLALGGYDELVSLV